MQGAFAGLPNLSTIVTARRRQIYLTLSEAMILWMGRRPDVVNKCIEIKTRKRHVNLHHHQPR